MLWPSCSLKAPINISSTAHFCKEGIKALGVGDPRGRGGGSGPVESPELMCQCDLGRLCLLPATLGSSQGCGNGREIRATNSSWGPELPEGIRAGLGCTFRTDL